MYRFIYIGLLLPFLAFGQQELQGVVSTEGQKVVGLSILNLQTEATATTDEQGKFALEVTVGDMLVIATPEFHYYRKLITEAILRQQPLQIQLEKRNDIEVLEEVDVYNRSISAEQLGLKIKPKMTRAQREYYAGGRVLNSLNLGTMAGVGLNLDAIINSITGKRRFLEQGLKLEQHEKNYEKLRIKFSNQVLYERYAISQDEAEDFLYYCSMQPETQAKLAVQSDAQLQFYISGLVVQYRENQSSHALD